jgi:glucose dehydrogenase
MFPANNGDIRGRLIAFDPVSGQTKWAVEEKWQVYSGPLTTDSGVLFYGTLDGWFKAVDQSSGKLLYEFLTPSGIIGNPMTYMHKGKQYVAVLTGVGGWAAIGLAEGLTKGTEGLGAVNLTTSLGDYTNLGGTLVVFTLD